MVTYKTTEEAFIDGRLQPIGTILTFDKKPDKPGRTWEEIKPETSQQRKRREAAEAKALKANQEKAEDDKKDASFMDDSQNVTTL